MSLAREINQKLDEILSIREEMETLRSEVSEESSLTNLETGDTMSRNDALKCADGVLERIYNDLNKLTNEGRNVRDIFNNTFYINDLAQDKKIADGLKEQEIQKKSDEIKNASKNSNFLPKPEINISDIRPSLRSKPKDNSNKNNSEFFMTDQNGNKMSREEFMKKWQEWQDRNKGKNK